MYGYIGGIGINHPSFNIISGPNALCQNQTATYSVNTLPDVTSYIWEVPNNMTIVPSGISTTNGQGTPSITVKANNGWGGQIKVTPNCRSKKATTNILDLNAIEIDGYDQACPNYTYTYSAPVITGANYFWSATNGNIVGSPNNRQVQLKMTQNPSNQSILHLQVTGVCSNPIYANKTIIHGDPPPPAQQCITIGDKGTPIAQPIQKMAITEFGDMLLYPNPATNEVTIVAPNKGHFILSIFNTMGQSIYVQSIEIEGKLTIDVNTFPKGVYYVKLEGETGNFTKKLILNK
ncbi:T9SS type A sorting domain-containing protein [Aequorivita marina]|uniref:T9SS type A sorting domain-containing protein n=1 Tax=Aequorivita marina TaxID=3073654 RepID=UPI002874814D|nr:T9SS type A sorting domain-containing protein [Aequorivita sp. S2608]MDS1297859.1 T9SS type A sorting domain-containing protein [Aequorivita sp. S2608]